MTDLSVANVFYIYVCVVSCCLVSLVASWMGGLVCFEDDDWGPQHGSRAGVAGRYGGGFICLCLVFPLASMGAGVATGGIGALVAFCVACILYGAWVKMVGPFEDDKWGPDSCALRTGCSVKFVFGSGIVALLLIGILSAGAWFAQRQGNSCVDFCKYQGFSRRRLQKVEAFEVLMEDTSRRLQTSTPCAAGCFDR